MICRMDKTGYYAKQVLMQNRPHPKDLEGKKDTPNQLTTGLRQLQTCTIKEKAPPNTSDNI